MAVDVGEIMNREVFSVKSHEPVADVQRALLELGISGAPVVDDRRRPLGVVSLRDLVGKGDGDTVAARMTAPAVVVEAQTRIRQAAAVLAREGLHRLIVVDADGRVAGVLSAVDLIRGLIGHPVSHPAAFSHRDATTGVAWTDDALLELNNADVAPSSSGVLALIRGGPGVAEAVVWAEEAMNLRARVLDLLSLPQREQPFLDELLRGPKLRFRVAEIGDRMRRAEVLRQVRGSIADHNPELNISPASLAPK